MSLYSISEEERNTITSILDDFEFDCIPPKTESNNLEKKFENLLDLDDNLKQIWPNWHGHSYVPTLRTSHSNSISPKVTFRTIETNTEDNILKPPNAETTNQSDKTKINDSQKQDFPRKTAIIQPRFQKNEYMKPLPLQNKGAQELVDSVDHIKDDIIDIMNKLSTTVESFDMIPDLVEAETPEETSEDSEKEAKLAKKKAKQIPTRTKAEVKASVIRLQRELNAEKEKNQKLEKQYQDLREKVIKSQQNLQDLRFEYRKSNIIYNEYKRREDEYKVKHPLTEASQVTSKFF